MERLLVSVSGGRTSALMAKLLKDKLSLYPVYVFGSSGKWYYTKYVKEKYEVIFVFANTSREDKKTFRFLNNITRFWEINIIWLEASVNSGRVGTSFKITNIHSAYSDGRIFESVISKYGIPNKKYIHCTRELKSQPIASFAKSIGWVDYTTVIGYRADEPKRVNLISANKNNQWYPLFEWKITKDDVLNFFKRQPFDLDLQEHEGNCRLCYKKSKRKLLTQIISDPDSVEWIQEMESKYRYFQKPERNNETITDGTYFFRDNESIDNLIEESKEPFQKYSDVTKKTLFDIDMDEQEGCEESCEPFLINP